MKPFRAVLRVIALFTTMVTLAACSGNDPGGPTPSKTPRTASPGVLWSAGLDTSGQLGRRSGSAASAAQLAPVTATAGSPVIAVAAGGAHTLAVRADGSVLSWGANDHGQLGHGTPGTGTPAGPVLGIGGTGTLTGVVQVAADTDFSMALRADGTVVTWGTGDAGQRGDGHDAAPPYPTQVLAPGGAGPLTNVKQIAADGRTELALLNDGRVVAWGANTFGMVGDGTRANRSTPVYVVQPSGSGELGDVRQVAIGGQNGLALLDDGSVLAWGHNDLGQLGDGTREDRPVPGPVQRVGGTGPLTDVVQVSAAEKHAFALLSDGTAVAWGNNTAGQLGDGSTVLAAIPVPVAGPDGAAQLQDITRIAAGEAYGVAIRADGSLWTWGANGKGQLGSGDRKNRDRPGPVAGTLAPVQAVAAGERHLVVLLSGTHR